MKSFLEDYITFTIDKQYEDTGRSGIIIINSAYIDPEESDRFIHKRTYGTVTSVPHGYSNTIIRAVDPGLPAPKIFIGHDWIIDKINRGYKQHSNKDYYPTTFDGYECVTLADLSKYCDIQIKDRVYFDEKVTEPDNFLGMLDGKLHYRARIDEVFCVQREWIEDRYLKKKMIMQGQWVLVEPDMETWDEITTKSGVIKKPNPEAKTLQGTIVHVRDREDMRSGLKIIYSRDADWTIKIEGKDYYVIQERDILAEI